MSLDRQAILAADDQQQQEVDVPEWGGSVFIRTLSGAERDAFEREFTNSEGESNPNVRARLAVRVLCDAGGTRIFADKDAGALGGKSGAVLTRIFNAALQANYMTAEDVEELEKNSAGGQSESSPSV